MPPILHLRRRHVMPLVVMATGFVADASAETNVTIYGRLNTAIEYSSASTSTNGTSLGSVVRHTNNRSVFGFRG